MAKGTNQKMKLLYLMKIFLEKTDENHAITMAEIISSLQAYDVTAERKSIYDDIEILRCYGLDIISEQRGGSYGYYVASRDFELAELKLLVDSVQSAKFMTAKKSKELIKKLQSLCSKHEAGQLQRQVYVGARVKTMNESIYYNVDKIHAAINENVKIQFHYYNWDVNKKMVLRREGALYEVSPWALSCHDENYYMVAYDSNEDLIKHFRVDKMLHIEKTDSLREGKEHFRQFDMGIYARKMFGMFDGREEIVTLQCSNEYAGVLIDRFGKDILIRKLDEHTFEAKVKVCVSKQFLSWVMGLGENVKITAPSTVVEEMKREIERLVEQYKD